MIRVKTLIAAIICIAFASPSLSARSGLGLRLSYDLTIPGDIKTPLTKLGTASGSGIQLGAVYTYSIAGGLYIEPGAMFYYDNYRLDEITTQVGSPNPVSDRPKISKTGLRIPLMAGYQVQLSGQISGLYLYTGPEFSFGFSAKAKSKILQDAGLELDNNLYGDDSILGDAHFRRFTTSWAIGAAVDINAINIGITATIGISDQLKGKPASMRENSLRLTVGYNF